MCGGGGGETSLHVGRKLGGLCGRVVFQDWGVGPQHLLSQ